MIILILIFVFLFGLIIGSFLNCLIWRLHKKESMMGRSYCPKCLQKIFWYDNIPLFSFAFLGGKCRHCRKKISWQYPLVEFTVGVLFLIAFLNNFQFLVFNLQTISNDSIFQFSNPLLIGHLFLDWFLIAIMTIIFIYDLRWYLILDVVTLPACIIVFLLNLTLGATWQNMLISGIIGGSFFLIQFLISRGKWIGGGDVRLGLLMGLALGWPMILVAILLAYFVGSIVGVGLILYKKKQWGSQVPLGIFLSTATIITLFWGEAILNWYLNLL
jgi:prepilin signal peptidase PulO-like enzyme (type II secretory pathway)